jgi:hypothetical protein
MIVVSLLPAILLLCAILLMRTTQPRLAWAAPLLLFFAFAGALCMAACGGGTSADPAATVSGTPAGNYMLTVTGTSANTTGSVNLALTVQ